MTSLSIAVVGTGAIGGAMAAALGDCGHSVKLCARTPFARLQRVHGEQTTNYDHVVHTSPDGIGQVDWVLLCTKTYQNAGAQPWLRELIGPRTRVAVMQNGVDHVERMASFVPPERVVPAIIMLPADVRAPGIVHQAQAGVVKVPATPAGQALCELFAGHELAKFEASEDFISDIWKKLVVNAAGGAICTLTLTPIRELSNERVRDLALKLMHEIVAVGRAEGAQIPDAFIEQCLNARKGPLGAHWTSIAVDWRDGRPMEWEARNAVVGKIGAKHGIPTPFNDALAALLALADEKGGRFKR